MDQNRKVHRHLHRGQNLICRLFHNEDLHLYQLDQRHHRRFLHGHDKNDYF